MKTTTTKRIHLLPNVITAFGLSCGLFVIFKMTMTPVGGATLQILTEISALLLLAALADLLDGAVARIMKAESDFGGFFDSLSDAITFGVAPSVIVLKSLSLPTGTESSFLLMTAAVVYSVCGVLRLVRFNVTSQQIKGDEEQLIANKKNFTGLPIPAGAAAAVSGNLFLVSNEFRALFDISEETRSFLLFMQMIILGYFMISRWKFPSLKTLHIRVASFKVVLITAVTAVFIFYSILHHFPLIFFLVSWGYLFVAFILSIIRIISGKKSKTLEDFEPEAEDEDLDE
jgi:CDP-diacylglycerol--serine O-phosphatidyltransferase